MLSTRARGSQPFLQGAYRSVSQISCGASDGGSHPWMGRELHTYANSIRACDIVLPAAGSKVTRTLLFVIKSPLMRTIRALLKPPPTPSVSKRSKPNLDAFRKANLLVI